MTIYYVNIGHFASFNEANRFRKEKLPSSVGYVFCADGTYTVRVMATPRKVDAQKWLKRDDLDIWIGERDTSAGGKDG